jgi:hypothetical protein
LKAKNILNFGWMRLIPKKGEAKDTARAAGEEAADEEEYQGESEKETQDRTK